MVKSELYKTKEVEPPCGTDYEGWIGRIVGTSQEEEDVIQVLVRFPREVLAFGLCELAYFNLDALTAVYD